MVAPHELRSPVCESTCFHSKYSIRSHSPKHLLESYGYRGGVAQLGEHLLCKHAVISLKSLNPRLFTVHNPLFIGLPIGLQKVRVLCDSLNKGGLDARKSIRAVSLRAFLVLLQTSTD